MKHRGWNRGLGVLLVVGIAVACSAPPSDARFVETVPDTTTFPAVAAMLIQSCGSLDCHATVGRNLRIYGDTGLRFSPTDVPSVLVPTTADEITQDYDAVIGLEPEIMSAVVASHASQPRAAARSTGSRSASRATRGARSVNAGDARDVCITTWLEGSADATACKNALSLP